jgi:hypothetical protein
MLLTSALYGAHWDTYVNACVPTGTQWAWCKKHHIENKLFDIFKALRLSWV